MASARADYAAGDHRWVVHILDQVIWAEPDNVVGRELAAAAHTQIGHGQENSTWRNAYLSVAKELRKGLPKGDKNHRVLRDALKGISPVLLVNSLSVRLNGPKAAGWAFTINQVILGTDEICHSGRLNAVSNTREGLDLKAALSVILPREMLTRLPQSIVVRAEFTVRILYLRGIKPPPLAWEIARCFSGMVPKCNT